nr:protein phosphatase 2C domain-containing protein [uncultured Halomonas sp.]|tara:strand:- start:1035 stop:1850 length:816 start_codon:yes stop_codon:yes gene_type:complete
MLPNRNEDHVHFDRRLALVLDGATGLGDPLLTGESSDAEWLVHAFTQKLIEAIDHHNSVLEGLSQAVHGVTELFWQKLGKRCSLPKHRLPSAGMALAALEGEEILLARFGDCSLQTLSQGVIQSPFPASPLEKLDNRAIASLNQQIHTGKSYSAARSSIKDTLKEHRNTMNTQGGYSALSVDPECLSYLEVKRIPIQHAPQRLLLASDGFAAAFEAYNICTAENIFMGETKAFSTLIKKIRLTEKKDIELKRYPRLKPHDDASALLIEVKS